LRQAQVTAGLHLELFNLDRQLMQQSLQREAFPPPLAGEGWGGGPADRTEVATPR
jgi:hypothetical protein